jgi:hypothetical protein
MRRRNKLKKKNSAKRYRDPNWFEPDVSEPDLVFNPEPDDPPRRAREEDEDEDEERKIRTIPLHVQRTITRAINKEKEAEEEEERDVHEAARIERDLFRMRYTAAIGRWKIAKNHSIKEYVV